MYSIYRGQDYFGVVKEYEQIQEKRKEEQRLKEERELELKKIYTAPGVYKFIPTPKWAKRSIISFRK